MSYALYSPENTVTRIVTTIDPNAQLKTGWKWLEIIEMPMPPYEASIQKVEQTQTITETQIINDWIVVDKTTEEILQEKEVIINSIDRELIIILRNQENRLRILEGNTLPQFSTDDEYKQFLTGLI